MTSRWQDNRQALADLYDQYGAQVYQYLLFLLSSSTEAEDALQEVFCRLWQRRHAYPDIENPRIYLFRSARNEAYSRLRWRWRFKIRLKRYQEQRQLLVTNDAHEDNVEEREAVSYALARLPIEQREVVVLKMYQNMTFEQIGTTLAISKNTAASRYRYALEKLNELLTAEGFGS